MQENNVNISKTAQAVDNQLEQQAANNERSAEQKSAQRKSGKGLFPILVLSICVAIIAHRAPRIIEPYQSPDDNTPAVVQAELELIVSGIEVYKFLNGKYPAAIADVWLPGDLNDVMHLHPVLYQSGEDSFTLKWPLPDFDASYDSHTKHLAVEKVRRH